MMETEAIQGIFTDTHTHLYLEQFDDDRQEMIQRALASKVKRFFLPNIDLASIEPMISLVNHFPEHCFPMMGLHPCNVNQDYKEQLQKIHNYLTLPQKGFFINRYFGVGEIGLDYFWDKTFIQEQQDALRIQTEWAKKYQLPVVLHTRDSIDDAIAIMQEMKDENLWGVFHCFTGTAKQAKKIIDLGFYLGIGGVVTFKNGGIDKIVQEVGLQHLVLETDAPYLAPVPYRGKRNESEYITLIAAKVAELVSADLDEVAVTTTRNAEILFRF